MGCTSSRGGQGATSQPQDLTSAAFAEGQRQSTRVEIKNDGKIEEPYKSQYMHVGGYGFNFAFVSQRGYYPDNPQKPNQDSYSAIPKLTDKSAFFAVYDGHGQDGHKCAWYTRDTLPPRIMTGFEGNDKEFVDAESVIKKAYLDTNEMLRKDAIDDSISGTTAISVLITPNPSDRGQATEENPTPKRPKIYINNVGDSRAMMISNVGGTLKGRALSNDQTPYRKDERERCRAAGARVLTMDQLDKNEAPDDSAWDNLNLLDSIDLEGDPPRIWLKNQTIPGCAFTRSIGDAVAEKVGCYAEPEIESFELQDEDKYIVLASDGVFEFIKISEITQYISSINDPLAASKAIVAEAYKRWLHYEDRTDDITCIIISCGERHVARRPSDIMIDAIRTASQTLLGSEKGSEEGAPKISRKARGRMSLAAGTTIDLNSSV